MLYPKDKKVRIRRGEKTLEISWRGSWSGYIFATLGLAVIAGGYVAGITPNRDLEPPTLTHFWICMSTFGALGLVFAYLGLAWAVNTVRIMADHERIVQVTGPIKLPERFDFRSPVLSSSILLERIPRSGS